MRLEFIGSLTDLAVRMPDRSIDIVILGLYLLLFAVVLYRYRGELRFSNGQQLIAFFVLLGLGLLAPWVARVVVPASGLAWSNLLPAPTEVAIPLLGVLPVLSAALSLGAMPAALVGLASGFAYAASANLTVSQALEGALFGLALACLLRPRYTRPLPAAVRQPIVLTPVMSLLIWPIPFYAHVMNPALWFGDMALWASLAKMGLLGLFPGLVAGGAGQVALWVLPSLRSQNVSDRTPVHQGTLAGRLLTYLLPLTLAAGLIAVVAINVVTMNMAFRRSLAQMEQAASSAVAELRTVIQRGSLAAGNLASAGPLKQLPPEKWSEILLSATITGMPFDQVFLLDRNVSVVAAHPAATEPVLIPTEAEITALGEALTQKQPAMSRVYWLQDHAPMLSFVAPVFHDATQDIRGAVLGRMRLADIPEMKEALTAIGNPASADWAYVIDERGNILLSTSGQIERESWVANPTPLRRFPVDEGLAYEERAPDGSTQVVYWVQAGQPAWHLVMERSRQSILHDAGQIAIPLLLMVAGIFGLLSAGTVTVVQLQLLPLRRLATAATRIAQGDLTAPIPVATSRGDELGQLARAIQHMTIGLGTGIKELARLVEVSQNISPRAGLEQSLPILLRSLTRGMMAHCAGIHWIGPEGNTRTLAVEGERNLPADVELLLEQWSKDIWRAPKQIIIPDTGTTLSEHERNAFMRIGLHALMVMPVLREGRALGTLWAGWTIRRDFSPADVSFCAALANLAGILIDNNQIYRVAESERSRLAAILAATHDGVLITDAQGRLQLANPAAEELLGFSAKLSAGQPLPKLIASDVLFRMLADIGRGRGPGTVEVDQNGRRLYISASAIAWQGRSNAPQGWVLVMRDVTDVKRHETTKTDFISRIAHDLNSPLTYMRGYASMLRATPYLDEESLGYVEKILKGVDDLKQRIDEMMDLWRVSNQVGLSMTPCQLTNLATQVAETLRPYAEGKGLTLYTELPLDLPMVVGDPEWLKQAMRNLIDNAIKYTPAPGWIKVSAHETATSVVVTVADSGIGIAPADRRRIFEPGYRVRCKETLHIHGTGLGLALVKEIAEKHGGQVWVESELGAGSAFHLSIPKERRLSDLLDEDSLFVGPSSKAQEEITPFLYGQPARDEEPGEAVAR